jgi:putative peptidoglycan lipid II flippase
MKKGLFRSTSIFSSMTAISRVLGFIRDMLIARFFGASAAIDAFYIAFRIPNFMRALFAEGAFSQAFVPVLSEYRETKTPEEVREFVARMQGALLLFLVLVVAFCMIFTPWITTVFAPGYVDEPFRFALTTEMLRITFPYILLISLTAFSGAVLNSYGSFGPPAFAPVLLNISMIIGAVWLAPHFDEPVIALAIAVLVAGVCQFAFQIPFLRIKRLLVLPKLVLKDEGVRRVGKMLVPALFGVSVAQISLLVDTLFASFLPAGSVTWLYYSNRLVYLPLGIFGVALATVILPHLSRKHTNHSTEEFSSTLGWALRCVLVIAIPSAVGLIMLAGPLFASLFQYGEFSMHDALMSSYSLIAYSIGLPAFMLVKVLASGFYSQQNIKTPVKIAVVALVMNVVLNFALIGPLQHTGLALATALSSTFNAGMLYVLLCKKGVYQAKKDSLLYLLKLLFAVVVMAALLWWLSPENSAWFAWNWQQKVWHLGVLLAVGMVSYFACLWVCGVRLRNFMKLH